MNMAPQQEVLAEVVRPHIDHEEWLVAWEAVAQYVENIDDDDPKRGVAVRLLHTMDDAFVRAVLKG